MDVSIPLELIEKSEIKIELPGYTEFKKLHGNSRGDFTIDVALLAPEQVVHLSKAVKAFKKHPAARYMSSSLPDLIAQLDAHIGFSKSALDTKIFRLDVLASVLKEVFGRTKHKWIFLKTSDGKLVPYLITKISYSPGRKNSPATTAITLQYTYRNSDKDRTLYFSNSDLMGKTVEFNEDTVEAPLDELDDFSAVEEEEEEDPKKKPRSSKTLTVGEIIANEGIFIETEALVSNYLKELKIYRAIVEKLGHQFLASGYGLRTRGYYGSSEIAMVREGRPTKVVVDDDANASEDDDRAWPTSKKRVNSMADLDFWKDGTIAPKPIHPYIQVFDLEKHNFLDIHSSNLQPYEYDKSLNGKLVLPPTSHNLVKLLVRSSTVLMEDIISGKTGGIIIIATGPPGTGKTLTAEVVAETLEKPLYMVQCSQLGTDEETLEKKLRTVLSNASRWGAILIVDEADVYIRERGDNIQQNAIVGVFLRLLEYYRGVLFMTSNRGEIIDDAILSRATAWIRYDKPDKDSLRKLWRILSTQFTIELPAVLIEELLETFPTISGRTVKNLLKLGKLNAEEAGEPYSVHLFKAVSGFLPLS